MIGRDILKWAYLFIAFLWGIGSAQSVQGQYTVCSLYSDVESNEISSSLPKGVSEKELSYSFDKVFSHALSKWESLLGSPIPLNVEFVWDELENNALAVTTVQQLYALDAKPVYSSALYPVSLAESLLGQSLNSLSPDMKIAINSNVNWYYGLDANTPDNSFDLLTVLLHEIAHGLGVFSSASIQGNNTGTLGIEEGLLIYDYLLEDELGSPLTDYIGAPQELAHVLTSQKVYLNLGNTVNRLKVYTPSPFEEQSSISHFDTAGIQNSGLESLMIPVVSEGWNFHDIEKDLSLIAVLKAIGWLSDPESAVICYPNPSFDGWVQISPKSLSIEKVTVLDLKGKVTSWSWDSENNLLKLYEPGYYFVKLQFRDRITCIPVVILK
ncbi:T9SS type A sorting domain-containing protein [Reichenbachiella ulvae]|uniref:T9SS type A sorting domain-containing protein n=1 Tax=Reichenbachiella ulvae TaxID=2980104 RepID=A0ABT3CWG7_9BACT|nr:T9SS type A sorting domain-containing protein [Reichenbachiella ulvae]MCV9387893.1 T9SS type A sorting domain-containing protein [Reichenbachiella ulvae]